jgi:dTDP-4-dehydrorhamnose reductase
MNSLVVRTSWLYGVHGNCFPRSMIRAFKAGKQLRVVSDQIGCPTSTVDLSRVLVDLAEQNASPGVYHATGPDVMSWYDFAKKAISLYAKARGMEGAIEVEPIRTEDWPTPARRPRYSVLSNEKLLAAGIKPMRHVDEALAEFVDQIEE